MLLENKVIVVSGVGPGMGQALARLAARDGAQVVLGARNAAYIEEVAADIRDQGGKAVALSTDVSDAGQCQALAAAAIAAFGRIDGLINSAYLHGGQGTVDVVDPEAFARPFDVNCMGALRMAQAVLPAMKAQRSGSIANVLTMAAVTPFPNQSAYSVAKGALATLTRYMAKDYAPFGVRANAARMGWIGGAPVEGHLDAMVAAGHDRDQLVSAITANIPLGVIPPEDDCARAVLFLLSDYSKVVNGAVLDVNGGEFMPL